MTLTRARFGRLAAAGLFAGTALPRAYAQTGGKMQQRKIPSSGEMLSVVGLGTWQTFDVGSSSAERAPRGEVLKALFEAGGWLLRNDIQFHWTNRGYRTFDDFLAALSSAKRKNLRKERAAAAQGVTIRRLTGADIRPEHWDAFFAFYQDTGMRKWGRPYLTREAFSLFGERMADRIVLVLAFDGDTPIAGALNFLGADALYGRYWGAIVDKPFLHFELCYYQAIDAAIELGLDRVEAGAQGQHKLARGYEPVQTTSAHHIADPAFRRAVADFLVRERAGVEQDQQWLGGHTPYRRETD